MCIESFRCVIVNWGTLDYTQFLGWIKNILQQLQNIAKTEKAIIRKLKYYRSIDRPNQVYIKTSDTMTLDCRKAWRVMHEVHI